METSRSGQRRRSPPRNEACRGTRYQLGHRGVDRISSLPDAVLLQVLVRVGCVRTVARTSLLSRRWCGLWIHLPELTFRHVAPGSVEAALTRVACRPVSLLDIRIPRQQHRHVTASISSMLRAAASLSPEELVCTLPSVLKEPSGEIDLPCFHRAISIELEGECLDLTLPPNSEFPVLERLTLSGFDVDIGSLVSQCLRLRMLSLTKISEDVKVHSESLEELAVDSTRIFTVDIVAPALKLLTLSNSSGFKPNESISAPMLEKVSWRRQNLWFNVGVGHWRLECISLQPEESDGHILSLHITQRVMPADRTFVQEIEKLPVTDFSSLELIIETRGHVFGAITTHLLGNIPTVTRRLKVVIQKYKEREVCRVNCDCDEHNRNWRSQAISLIDLEEVEIKGLRGEDDEVDFLKLLFRCAPMLKQMIVQLSDEVTPSNDGYKKIYNISMTCPHVKCYVYLSSGKRVVHA